MERGVARAPGGHGEHRIDRRPKLIASLARRIAAIGRLPYLGEVIHDGPSAGAAFNSAHRFRSVWGTYTLAPETEASLPDHRGRPSLVDDCLDTGWTMTMVTPNYVSRVPVTSTRSSWPSPPDDPHVLTSSTGAAGSNANLGPLVRGSG